MKGKIIYFFVALTLIAGSLSAQQAGSGRRKAAHNYDVNSETSIRGTVRSVEKTNSTGGQQGVHLVVQTSGSDTTVHVGPQWFLDEHSFTLNKGDDIQVTGSLVNLNSMPVIIAKSITKGSQRLVLRHNNGTPMWSGRGRP